jgi:LCP family protein required for cell wall assembly
MENESVLLIADVPVRKRGNIRPWLKRTALVLLAVLLLGGGFLGWKAYGTASKISGSKNPLAVLSSFTPTTLKETNGRINILAAGYSADDSGHAGAALTDSIMIVSINPTDKSIVIISVPRDLYVNIPGIGYSKINAAYEYGEADDFSESGYARGGMGLLEKVVQQNFGVQSNYYALINYTAFKDAVDAVGGVSVNIQSSNAAGLYDPNTGLNLPNGQATLDGNTALALARARGDSYDAYGFPNSDFDRTVHQQQILIALKDKVASAGVISNPLKIGKLADALGDNVKTDLTIGDMETLYTKTKGISDSNIISVTLNNYNGTRYLSDYTTASGQSALIPSEGIDDYTGIQGLVQSLLTAPSKT